MTNFYKELNISAFDAISIAQKIASGPMLFQTACTLIDHGILSILEKHQDGLTLQELAKESDLNEYALGVLMDMAASGQIVLVSDDEKYTLSKVGFFLLNDNMTQINLRFTQHICYEAMAKLDEALTTGKPSGLAHFDKSWETIYPHLSELPPKAKKAWFEWDHLYSQTAFKQAILKMKEEFDPKLIFDVGGNTGKFSIACCNLIEDAKVKILDLPCQIELAKANIKEHGLEDRIEFLGLNILDDNELPQGADIWWMSQFIDCFNEDRVLHILGGIYKAIKDDAHVCILEPIADRQKFEAASYSINAGSLYFTAIANGYSRFFSTKQLTSLIEKAGFKVDKIIDNLGISNSLFVCSKA